ncbi:acyl-CoA thioester hydrolase [Nocardioides sp. BE266]|nr:acyl-CoA thioester hydrolase [Nocardioides sp. BE266]
MLEGTVEPGFIDLNGHMNIRHYLDAGAQSADIICRRIGIDDDYRARRRLGVFTAEHHISYFTEMHEGDRFTVHTLWIDRSERAGHLVAMVLDRTDEVLSCVVEIALVHVGMDSRRPAPFPADIAAVIDSWIDDARRVNWDLPLSGAMGIRRPDATAR